MRLRKIVSMAILAVVLVAAGLFAMNAANAAPGDPAPVATVAAPDAQPDSEVAAADVPIAGVAPEAAGVNEGELEQASGIPMTSDTGKGQDAGDVSDSALAGGCLPGYGGKKGECLPPIPPRLVAEHAGHAGMLDPDMAEFYTCEDVTALIPKGLLVQGEDYLDLDTNGDGVACGKGD